MCVFLYMVITRLLVVGFVILRFVVYVCGCSSLLFALGWWLFGLLFELVGCFNVCY